jgi:hypothetical protein
MICSIRSKPLVLVQDGLVVGYAIRQEEVGRYLSVLPLADSDSCESPV